MWARFVGVRWIVSGRRKRRALRAHAGSFSGVASDAPSKRALDRFSMPITKSLMRFRLFSNAVGLQKDDSATTFDHG
jgi:hypothetical protein